MLGQRSKRSRLKERGRGWLGQRLCDSQYQEKLKFNKKCDTGKKCHEMLALQALQANVRTVRHVFKRGGGQQFVTANAQKSLSSYKKSDKGGGV